MTGTRSFPSEPAAVMIVVCACASLAAPASGGGGGAAMTLLTQQRAINSFVIVPPCAPGTTDSDTATAVDFLPFGSKAHAEKICDLAQGIGSGDQVSTITTTALIAEGSATSSAASEPQTVIHAITSSTYKVTFALNQASAFRLEGQLSAEGGLPVIVANARVRLVDSGGAAVFEQTAASGGDAVSIDVNELIELDPGTYSYTAEANAWIDAMVPPVGEGTSSFNLAFNLLDPVDLDQDGDVDGFDLALLLGAWGNCPINSICGCPADLDCSGSINGTDLAVLLAAWG
jgi:hypothetical protein